MTASRGTTLLALAGSLCVATSGAIAGPSSPLDPYAHIQAPRPAARKPLTPKPASVRHGSLPRPSSSVPKQASSVPKQASSGAEGGVVSGMKEIGGGFVDTSKAATAGIANTYKKAGAGVVKGGKFVGHSFINGAKASGSFFARGAKTFGNGVVAAGTNVKDGTAAAGAKVVSLPGALHGGSNPPQQNQSVHDLKEAPRSQTASAQPQPPQASARQSLPQSDNSDGSSLGGKVVAVPKAIGHGFVFGAGKVKDGTQVVGKRMISFPGAVWGKLVHHGGEQSQ